MKISKDSISAADDKNEANISRVRQKLSFTLEFYIDETFVALEFLDLDENPFRPIGPR